MTFETIITALQDHDQSRLKTNNFYIGECVRLEREIDILQDKIDILKKYFTSGNPIPVERATILAKDFWDIIGEQP